MVVCRRRDGVCFVVWDRVVLYGLDYLVGCASYGGGVERYWGVA